MSDDQELVDAVNQFERAVRDSEGYFAGPSEFARLDMARRLLLVLAGARKAQR